MDKNLIPPSSGSPGVFEFINDNDRVISELLRITAKSGTVCFTTLKENSVILSVDKIIAGILSIAKCQGRANAYQMQDSNDIIRSAENHGLELTEHSVVNGFGELPLSKYNVFTFCKI